VLTQAAEKDNEIKKLQEDISALRSLTKNRDQLLNELD
jgi:hypothetical protein